MCVSGLVCVVYFLVWCVWVGGCFRFLLCVIVCVRARAGVCLHTHTRVVCTTFHTF